MNDRQVDNLIVDIYKIAFQKIDVTCLKITRCFL